MMLALLVLLAGCGGTGLNGDSVSDPVSDGGEFVCPAEKEFVDLMPSTMLHSGDNTQKSMRVVADAGAALPTGYVTTNTAITDEPSVLPDNSNPADCGLTGTIQQRVDNCASSSNVSFWEGEKYGTGAEANWKLVFRTMDGAGDLSLSVQHDVWIDLRTQKLWTSKIAEDPDGNGGAFSYDFIGTSWSVAQDYCSSALLPAFGGIDLVGESVSWYMPSLQDFQLVNIDGFYWLYKIADIDNLDLWTSTLDFSGKAYKLLFGTLLRNFETEPSMIGPYNFICVGNYSGTKIQ